LSNWLNHPIKQSPNNLMKRNRVFLIALVLAALALWFLLAPPRWWLNLTKPVDLSDPARAGAQVVEKYDCRGCHRIDGRGSLKAPDLTGVTERLNTVSLWLWLGDPKAVKGNTAMPNVHLSDPEIEAVIAYLRALDAHQGRSRRNE
jgi:mono/diheme cytochrome c family protein